MPVMERGREERGTEKKEKGEREGGKERGGEGKGQRKENMMGYTRNTKLEPRYSPISYMINKPYIEASSQALIKNEVVPIMKFEVVYSNAVTEQPDRQTLENYVYNYSIFFCMKESRFSASPASRALGPYDFLRCWRMTKKTDVHVKWGAGNYCMLSPNDFLHAKYIA